MARDGLSDLYHAHKQGVKIRIINSVASALHFMSRKQKARSDNPDLRRATQLPGPPIPEIEALLWHWLTPESFKPSRLTRLGQKTARSAIDIQRDDGGAVLSLVYRRISGLSEVVRVLESEGLLWVDPFKVSKQALSKRLACLPADLFGQVFELTSAKIRTQADKLPIPVGWESVCQSFSAIWIADGSTLEAKKKKTDNPSRLNQRIRGSNDDDSRGF